MQPALRGGDKGRASPSYTPKGAPVKTHQKKTEDRCLKRKSGALKNQEWNLTPAG